MKYRSYTRGTDRIQGGKPRKPPKLAILGPEFRSLGTAQGRPGAGFPDARGGGSRDFRDPGKWHFWAPGKPGFPRENRQKKYYEISPTRGVSQKTRKIPGGGVSRGVPNWRIIKYPPEIGISGGSRIPGSGPRIQDLGRIPRSGGLEAPEVAASRGIPEILGVRTREWGDTRRV